MVDIPYRYNVSPSRSGKCNVFKPTALQEDQVLRSDTGGWTCACQLLTVLMNNLKNGKMTGMPTLEPAGWAT